MAIGNYACCRWSEAGDEQVVDVVPETAVHGDCSRDSRRGQDRVLHLAAVCELTGKADHPALNLDGEICRGARGLTSRCSSSRTHKGGAPGRARWHTAALIGALTPMVSAGELISAWSRKSTRLALSRTAPSGYGPASEGAAGSRPGSRSAGHRADAARLRLPDARPPGASS